MPNELAKLLADDIDDDITEPRASCLPTQLITLDELHSTRPLDLNAEYYQHLAEALDAALNL